MRSNRPSLVAASVDTLASVLRTVSVMNTEFTGCHMLGVVSRLASKLAALIALLRKFLAQFLPSTGGVPPEPTPDPPTRDRPAFEPISVNLRT